MNKLKISKLVFIVTLFTSCDCLQHAQGVVIDSKTRLPINNVMVKENSRDWIIHTDSLGTFEFTSMTGSLLGCPKISLTFEKEGYKKIKNKYKSCCTDSIVIVLEKQTK